MQVTSCQYSGNLVYQSLLSQPAGFYNILSLKNPEHDSGVLWLSFSSGRCVYVGGWGGGG